MSEAMPLISVLVPAYNHESYIDECIRSVWEQDDPNVEIVLVDDGSRDGTADLARGLCEKSPISMRVFQQENRGINRTLNRALGLARGELIAVIASDDKFAPSRFSAQRALFAQRPRLQVVYANGRFWENGELAERVHDESVLRLLAQDAQSILQYLYTNVSPLYLQSCLIRRDFVQKVGGFDESVLADDWVLNIRMFQALQHAGEFAYADEDVFYYRRHGTNTSKDLALQSRRVLEVIDKYTPVEHQPSFRRRMYMHYARIALSRKNLGLALRYFMKGRAAQSAAGASSVSG